MRRLSFRRDAEHQEAPVIIRDASVRFDATTVLESFSLNIQHGEMIGIIGPNGAGKTTLLRLIAGLIKPWSGELFVFGRTPAGHRCISYVPQRSTIDWHFPVTALDLVLMGRVPRLGLLKRPGAKDRRLAHEALEAVNLGHVSHRHIGELSGGQQQRVFIARALAQEAHLLLLDEPLTGLDSQAQTDIFHLLGELHRNSVTVLMSLHDLEQANRHFQRILLMKGGVVADGGPGEVLTHDNLSAAYGRHLHLDQHCAVMDPGCSERGC